MHKIKSRFCAASTTVDCRRWHKTHMYVDSRIFTTKQFLFCSFFSIYIFAIQFFRFCFRCSPSILITDVNSAEQWYFKFRNWCSVVVRGEWLWLHANISDEHNIGGSVSTGATRIRGWMPARMVHRGNYTVDGAIMFGGNFHENLIQFQSSKRWLDICLSLCEKVLGLIGSMCIASVFFDDDDRCK